MFHCLPDSAWADGNLAEAAGQLGKMVVHRNQSQPNPGLSSLGTPCISFNKLDNKIFLFRDPNRPFSQEQLFNRREVSGDEIGERRASVVWQKYDTKSRKYMEIGQ